MLPVIIDARKRIVSGHAVVKAAIEIGLTEIPTVRLDDLSEAELRALRISLHKIEELAEFDADVLKAELSFIAETEVELLTFTAFDSSEIDVIVDPPKKGKDKDKPDPDDVMPPIQAVAVSRLGDIWRFDKGHRLACGDALDPDIYRRLMGGVMARMIIADPPFNVPIAGHVSGRPGVREFAAASGEMSREQFIAFLSAAFRLAAAHSLDGSLHLYFMDWRHIEEMMAAGHSVYQELKNLIVWTKSNAGMGSLWRSQHELVFAWKRGTAAHVNNVNLGSGGRWRSNVWNFPGANAFGHDRDRELADHPTPKNVAMIKEAIFDVTRRGDTVLDCFCGAGTTLLAAHRAKRIGVGIEIDPLYVDAAVRRMEERTGQPAYHAETGLSFAEMAAERAATKPAAKA